MIEVVSSAKISEKHRRVLQKRYPDIRFYFFDHMKEALTRGKSADILITYGEDLTEVDLQHFSSLKWVQVISAGVERLPFQALQSRNIQVTNARGIHEVPMSEYALAVMLQILRRVNELYLDQRKAHWNRDIRMEELAGKTVSVIGAGAIGTGIAKRAQAFDAYTVGLNTTGKPVPYFDETVSIRELGTVLSRSDFVIITLPLTSDTKGLIGKGELEAMKSTGWLINMGRGAVVDEEALQSALDKKQIGGAVLDVFSHEPLPEEHPFWQMENVILTPHISGRSPLYMTRAMRIFQQNLDAYVSGSEVSVNRVSLDRGY